MLNLATRGVPRVPPSHFAAPHSYFLRGGGISKKEWAAKARGGFLLGKRKGVIQMQYKVEPRHTKFFKEWRGANPICVCPTLPCAHIIPAVLGKIIKRWG